MIHVRLKVHSPALRAGLSSLIAEDPDIDIVADGLAPPSGEFGVLILATRGTESESSWDVDPPPEWAILLLRDEPVDMTSMRSLTRPWGVLPLDASAEELHAAVHALAAGLVVGNGSLLGAGPEQAPVTGPLTEREVQVLGLLAAGLANKQIALELGISEHTVKFHVSSIYGKLNAANRTQAVREGLRNGWIAL